MTTEPRLYDHGLRDRNDRSGRPIEGAWAGNRLIFRHLQWRCDEAVFTGDCSHHLVVLTDSGHTGETSVREDGRLIYQGRDRPGVVSFAPANLARRCYYRDVDMSYSCLWIDPAFEAGSSERPGASARRPAINFSDPCLASLLGWLRDEVVSREPLDELFVERIAALILRRLAALEARAAPEPTRRRHLDGRRLAALEAFIEANLGGGLSLSELAAQSGMPQDTFARHFRDTTGQSPYAFIIERRLRRAETMMAEGEDSLARIALACGFSSQSHFTSAFRQRRSTTPAAWRARSRP